MQVDGSDYWLIAEDLAFAAARRKAITKLDRATHAVLIRGPEGDQVHYDEKGRKQKGGKARTEYKGFERYLRDLQIEAGLLDPEVEQVAEQLIKSDRFWGEAPPLEASELPPSEENEPVTDG